MDRERWVVESENPWQAGLVYTAAKKRPFLRRVGSEDLTAEINCDILHTHTISLTKII